MLVQNSMPFRWRALMFALVAFVVVIVLWNVPALSPLVYPFRLFVTYVHEAGHSLMALLTNGSVSGFTVSPNGTGVATTRGGNMALILPAGYLGAAFFGAVLFYVVNTVKFTRLIAVALGLGLVGFTVLFARPDAGGALTALAIGLAFGVLLIVMGWRLSQGLNLLMLNILAMITALNAVLDLFSLAQNTGGSLRSGGAVVLNDAAAFSTRFTPMIPAVVWAVVWATVALLMLFCAIYFSVIRPIRAGKG